MDDKKITEYILAHPSKGRTAIATSLNISESKARRMIDKLRAPKKKSGSKIKPKAVTMDDFREELDVPYLIRKHIQYLPDDGAFPDAEFRDLCGANPARWRQGAQQEEFRQYQFQHKGRTYWADPQFCNRVENLKRGRWEDE